MQRILFICHGNICRSTMAESVLTELVRRAGREAEFVIDSAATSTEEIGNPKPILCRFRQPEENPLSPVPQGFAGFCPSRAWIGSTHSQMWHGTNSAVPG